MWTFSRGSETSFGNRFWFIFSSFYFLSLRADLYKYLHVSTHVRCQRTAVCHWTERLLFFFLSFFTRGAVFFYTQSYDWRKNFQNEVAVRTDDDDGGGHCPGAIGFFGTRYRRCSSGPSSSGTGVVWCLYVRMYLCMYVSMYVCMWVCVCVCVWIFVYVCQTEYHALSGVWCVVVAISERGWYGHRKKRLAKDTEIGRKRGRKKKNSNNNNLKKKITYII